MFYLHFLSQMKLCMYWSPLRNNESSMIRSVQLCQLLFMHFWQSYRFIYLVTSINLCSIWVPFPHEIEREETSEIQKDTIMVGPQSSLHHTIGSRLYKAFILCIFLSWSHFLISIIWSKTKQKVFSSLAQLQQKTFRKMCLYLIVVSQSEKAGHNLEGT